MQVPTKNPGVRMGDMPGVRVGNAATGDDFGAAYWRDLERLGQAGLHAGNSALAEAQRRQHREDQTFVRDQINQAQLGLLEESQRIFKKTGKDADTAPQEMETILESSKQNHAKALKNRNQQQMFDDAWSEMAQRNQVEAVRHRQRQMDVYEKDTLVKQINAITRKANMTAAPGQGVNQADVDAIIYNTDMLTQGRPEEARQLARDQAAANYYKSQAASFAAIAPAEALRYLEDDRVKKAFTPAEYKALTEGYLKAHYEKEQSGIVDRGVRWCAQAVRDGAQRSDLYLQLVKEIGKETADRVMGGLDKWSGYVESEAKAAGETEKARLKERHDKAAAIARQARKDGVSLVKFRDYAYREFDSETAEKAVAAFREEDEAIDSVAADEQKAAEEKREAAAKRGDDVLTRSAKREGRELAGKMTNKELRDHAYANFPEKYAEILVNAWEAEEKALALDKAAAEIEREEALDKELKAAGYDAKKMPSYENLPVDEQVRLTKLGNELLSANGKKSKVNESLYLQSMFDTPIDDLSKTFADPNKRAALVKALGGVSSQQYKDVAARVKDARKSGSGGGGSDKIKSLDSILNNLKTEAEIVFTDTGRFVGTDANTKNEREEALNRIISYGRHEFEAAMKRHKADDIDALPLDERNRIFSEALVSYEIDEWGWSDPVYTRAEAWSRNVDLSAASTVTSSLPQNERANLYQRGEIRERNGVRFQEDIPLALLPDNIRIAAANERATVMRNLVTGVYVLTPHNPDKPRILFSPDTLTVREEIKKPVKTDAEETEVEPGSEFTAMVERVKDIGGIGLRGRE